MAILLLRFALAPLTILVVTLVQRRFGHASGGRIVGLPLTTGPFLVLIAITEGPAATSVAAAGIVAGQISVVAYCTAYSHLARRLRPALALPGALTVALIGVLVIHQIGPLWLALVALFGITAVALLTWPRDVGDATETREPAAWELPTRMAIAAVLVGTLTIVARVVSPFLAGMLASAPVILSLLAPLTHRGHGVDAASAMLRGTVWTMPATILFAAVVAVMIVPLGSVLAFVLGFAALFALDAALAAVRSSGAMPALSR